MLEINLDNLEEAAGDIRRLCQAKSAITLVVLHEGLRFPVFLAISPRYRHRLLVAYNGAVDRSRARDGIIFQRSSWSGDVQGTFLSFADPTLQKSKDLAIGWGQLERGRFGPELYIQILDRFRKALVLPSASQTLHFGSSAGGFQAVCAATYDRGSLALANNPQLDWTKYGLSWQVRRVREAVLGYSDEAELLGEEPWRARVWELFAKCKYIPAMKLLINTQSHNDFDVQLPSFLNGMKDLNFSDRKLVVEVELYSDVAAGHNPLPKTLTLLQINSMLQRLPPASGRELKLTKLLGRLAGRVRKRKFNSRTMLN